MATRCRRNGAWLLALMLVALPAACSDDSVAPADAALDGTCCDARVDLEQTHDRSLDHSTVDVLLPDAPASDAPVVDAPLADAPLADAPPIDLPPPMDALDGSSALDGGVVAPGGTAADIAKYCVKAMSCTFPAGSTLSTANDCLRAVYGTGGITNSLLTCIGKGTGGCADSASCTGIAAATPTCTTITFSSCKGSTYDFCIPGPSAMKFIVDCQKTVGTGCVTYSIGSIQFAGCSSGKTCSAPTGAYCSGNIVANCRTGKEILSPDCAAQGLVCRNGKCAGPGGPCIGTLSTCDGPDTIAYCAFGYRVRVKCSALGAGFSCKPSAVTGARCQQGTACNPDTASGTETCTGSLLNVCNAGKVQQVDCKALGFSGCLKGNCTP